MPAAPGDDEAQGLCGVPPQPDGVIGRGSVKPLEEAVSPPQRDDPDPPEADAVAPQGLGIHADSISMDRPGVVL